jgi:hypothetical protein
MNSPNFKFSVGQRVRFGRTNKVWKILSREYTTNAEQPQYFLESTDCFPCYHQWLLESDLREVVNV